MTADEPVEGPSAHLCKNCPGPNPYREDMFGYPLWELRTEIHVAFMTGFGPVARFIILHPRLFWLICIVAVVGVAGSAWETK